MLLERVQKLGYYPAIFQRAGLFS